MSTDSPVAAALHALTANHDLTTADRDALVTASAVVERLATPEREELRDLAGLFDDAGPDTGDLAALFD
ncbi:hypothetical protein GCM10009785_35160 [Brooklawnia cerclae]|uniref:Uncharacterized protein n=1 Tax=Brooklawnia cerclae TaxID=349934 RepID=A0ABX0SFG8_9ACTN|nr:hypothetical protein [Brooklawnia cerclae]NIH55361.1 hypothetical protein [Brooklawnia cerclae]